MKLNPPSFPGSTSCIFSAVTIVPSELPCNGMGGVRKWKQSMWQLSAAHVAVSTALLFVIPDTLSNGFHHTACHGLFCSLPLCPCSATAHSWVCFFTIWFPLTSGQAGIVFGRQQGLGSPQKGQHCKLVTHEAWWHLPSAAIWWQGWMVTQDSGMACNQALVQPLQEGLLLAQDSEFYFKQTFSHWVSLQHWTAWEKVTKILL